MNKYWKLLILFCFSTVLSGCISEKPAPQPLCKVVTQVDITCQQKDMLIHRHYTDSQKMQFVLLYLRLLNPRHTSQPVPEQTEDLYEIRILFSNGSQRVYRQKFHRYLSRDDAPWQTISPQQAAGLYTLMRALPSDPENANFIVTRS